MHQKGRHSDSLGGELRFDLDQGDHRVHVNDIRFAAAAEMAPTVVWRMVYERGQRSVWAASTAGLAALFALADRFI